ncbi:diguanylate cyclase (GGDEF)-like protein [Anaerosolibacter carboniphilus]|uniref:Diguanylate cyclase (GGDEF)-like protein n=1 Tax=Anaerosolibacter carboniphilus TaxID=1417629 RepID=A0A841KZ59_9FIRM|nr:diguanylate cyclase [Anaerosolibacter carboniphilus]MBB6218781.1 diguanylate cyclase (GGDEF)-like protein [Anaerosolibacter carboniphilus]
MTADLNKLEAKIAFAENEEKVDLLNSLSKEIYISNPKRALALAEEAYVLADKTNYALGVGRSLLMMSYSNRSLSNYDECMTKALDAMGIFRELGDQEGEMRALNLVGINYFYFSRYEQALEYFSEGLRLAQEIHHEELQASILNNIGEIYRELEKYQEALDNYRKALIISEKINRIFNVAVIRMNIGHIYNSLGQSENALKHYEKSLKISEEIGDHISKGEVLNTIGEIYEKLGQPDVGLDYYLQSLNILRKCENKFYQIDVLLNLGSFYVKQKRYEEGVDFLQNALNLAEEIAANKKIYTVHLYLSRYHEERGDLAQALSHYRMYHNIEKRVITDNLEEKLKILTIEYRVDKIQKESEIHLLKNIELKQKNEEIENKAQQMESINKALQKEILKRKELQEQLEQVNKELERMSFIDELTGIPNRRSFNNTLEKEWSRCLRESVPLSLIFIDVDYFKSFNDHYGHPMGDDCLRDVAKTLASTLKRSSDFIGRHGGEEFAIVLPNTDYEGSIMIAEQMRKAIENLGIRNPESDVSRNITISIGLANVEPSKEDNIYELIKAADRELYHAKNQGRNQVCGIKI